MQNSEQLISRFSYEKLCNVLIGNIVNFKSNCQIFPEFDITGLVLSVDIAKNNEYIIKIIKNGKTYDIGSHMHNLSFNVL